MRRDVSTLGDTLDLKHNSLNFLRLVLALCVLLSHAASLGGFGNGWGVIYNKTSLAQVALYGFFGISGYLLAASAMRSGRIAYVWHRCLRILPGLIACLVVTAFGLGVLTWFHYAHPGCGFSSCYLDAKDSPITYVLRNSLLANPYNHQLLIASGPLNVIPSDNAWNVSIWTLFYEFLCYLILLGLAMTGALRHRFLTLCATLSLWAAILVITATPSLSAQFSVFHFSTGESLMRLAVIFFTGTTLYLYRDMVPDSGWLALGCALLYVLGIALPIGSRVPTFNFTAADVFVALTAYPVLWLGAHLPFRRVGTKNDCSYGIYVYGWPVTTVLLAFGATRWGPVPFLLLCVACTAPFAVASWWLVEKRALRLKGTTWRLAWSRLVGEPARTS